jgi:hypothetical protein
MTGLVNQGLEGDGLALPALVGMCYSTRNRDEMFEDARLARCSQPIGPGAVAWIYSDNYAPKAGLKLFTIIGIRQFY